MDEARAAGYAEMVLDTLATMEQAQRLYQQLGFHEIPEYGDHAVPGTRFLGRSLGAAGPT
jgi:ribosomal protein S18 acetylase RimI-like enzyme